MEPSALRNRRSSRLGTNGQVQLQMDIRSHRSQEASWEPREPPKYTIDLSRPPKQRYLAVVKDFKDEIRALPFLFDQVVMEHLRGANRKKVKWLAKLLLRGVYNKEEDEELKGIHEVTGIDMYLLVAFNVLLDLFMGCTSGGVEVADEKGSKSMLHFRTLDWGMPALRKVIVRLDYVKKVGEPVIASSITYAGYVGVLTGVKPGMSMSLNFRPTHDASSRLKNYRFYFNHLLVLLGWRPSISSILRQCLLPTTKEGLLLSENLENIERYLPSLKTTAAYLIFSNGQRTITMQKDHTTAYVRSSTDFVVITNHDIVEEEKSQCAKQTSDGNALSRVQQATGMELLVEESTNRKACMTSFYDKATKYSLNRKGSKQRAVHTRVTSDRVTKWMDSYPITNEETHFATMMDPRRGEILWTKMYPEEMTEGMIENAADKTARRR